MAPKPVAAAGIGGGGTARTPPARAETRQQQIADEVADIAIYLFELADNLHIDLLPAMAAKLEGNAVKYPIEKAKGRSNKYTDF